MNKKKWWDEQNKNWWDEQNKNWWDEQQKQLKCCHISRNRNGSTGTGKVRRNSNTPLNVFHHVQSHTIDQLLRDAPMPGAKLPA
jgi:hypothetical protein